MDISREFKLHNVIPPGGAGPLNFVFSGKSAIFPNDLGAESDE
jgi:hypothetical protein